MSRLNENSLKQIVKGKQGAPEMTVGELVLRWESGVLTKNDIEFYYGITEKQIFEFAKAIKQKGIKE